MSFLNSGLLLGLLAVGIPILIHLFSRRRFPLINFSTLKFLKRLQRQQMRRLKLRQWLLLLLRTLAILLITLAFARPALKGILGAGVLSSGRISLGIIIDGSASMQASAPNGNNFEQAKTAAQTLISLMNPSDRALIVLARKNPIALTSTSSDQPELLKRTLQEAQVWDGPADLSAALDFTVKELDKSQDFRREIYIISDFAQVIQLPPPPPETQLFLVSVQPESRENLAIKEVKVVSEIIEAGQPVDIEVTLANTGAKERKDVYYSVFLNGSRVVEDVVTLAAGGEVVKTHQVTPESPGMYEGSVQIEEKDALAVDNKAYFCFAVPQLLSVLLVADAQDGREIHLAITPKVEDRSLIALQQVNVAAWETQTISQYDVLIFCNPRSFSAAAGARLAHYVENGGGMLLLPGNNTDINSVNRDLLEKITQLRWGEKLGRSGQRGVFLGWTNLDLSSPLLRGMLRSGSQPSSPQLFQALRIVGSETAAAISCSNGMPFIAETVHGQGRVLLCASSPQPEWSDWAKRGIFAPLLHRMVLKLAGSSQESCQILQAGAELKIPVKSNGGESAVLKTPSGAEIKLTPQVIGQKLFFAQQALEAVGSYHIQARSNVNLIAVNVPPSESNLTAQDLEAAFPAWEAAGARVVAAENLSEQVKAARYGQELWKVALMTCLGVLLLESVLGSGRKSEVSGQDKQTNL